MEQLFLTVYFIHKISEVFNLTIDEGGAESSEIFKIKQICTENNKKGKKKLNFQTFISSDYDHSDQTGSRWAPLFCPLHIITFWTEPGTTNRCITVAIVLRSGIGPGNVSSKVLEGGRIF